MESGEHFNESRRRVQRTRRRIEKACETCRRRKERCDGARPKCSNCKSAARDCAYSSESKKRGLPEGWVRGLEKLWALAIIRAPGIDEDVVSIVKSGLNDPHKGDLAAIWTDETHEKGLLRRWKASQLSQELEQLLPALERLPHKALSETLVDKHLNSKQDGFDNNPSDAAQRNHVENISDPDANSSAINSAAAVQPQHIKHSVQLKSADSVTLPANSIDLIDAYFTWTHIWFPILERHKIYKAYHQWPELSTGTWSGDQACILAILAYQQVQRDDVDGSGIREDEFALLSCSVRNLIPTEYRKCQLSHVQAILILALAHLGAGLCDDAWLLVGQATRLGLLERTIDAQQSRGSDKGPGTSQSRLYHVLTGCYILDTLLSTVSALPSHVHDRYSPDLGKLSEDGNDEWTPVATSFGMGRDVPGPAFSISTFNRLVEVTEFLGRVTRKASSSVSFLSQLETAETDLFSWDNSQIPSNRLSQVLNPGLESSILSHQVTIHLIHLAASIIIAVRTTGQQSNAEIHLKYRIQQLVDFMEMHILKLEGRAICPAWQLVLSLLLSELENLRKLFNFVAPLGFYQTLYRVLSLARSQWPVFDSLHARVQTHLQARAALETTPVYQTPYFNQGDKLAAQSTHGFESWNSNPSDITDLPAMTTQACQQNHEVPPESQRMAGSIFPEGIDDSVSTLPDFVTMDALNWEGFDSFQNLGFADIENTNDGLQSFFQSM